MSDIKNEVVRLKSEGKTVKEICQILDCKEHTVRYNLKVSFCPCGNDKHIRATICKHCRSKQRGVESSITIDSNIGDKTYTKHKYAKYSYIRWHAKKVAKEAGMVKCANCAYEKHVEIAHIKPISEFDPSAKIREVNDIDNLIPLCPNCHWEFDYGDLTISEIKMKSGADQSCTDVLGFKRSV
jgi:5-methylcytosine-specific restriction endonuclease McrA